MHGNQIDYVLIKNRFKNALSTCKTYPGSDIGSDHNPVIMKMKLKLKIPENKKNKKCLQFDVSRLKDDEVRTQYAMTTKNWFECLMTKTEMEAETENLTPQKNIDKHWTNLKTAINEAYVTILPRIKREAKQPWMATEILGLMKDQNYHKGKPTCR